MFTAIVDIRTAPADRDAALAVLLAEAPAVRAMSGNRTFRPHVDRTDPALLGVLHEWDREEDFAAYLTSLGFVRSGQRLRELMSDLPSSRRYRAELAEEVR